jgi:DNA repair exonuclease SbcCD ATPase subunit
MDEKRCPICGGTPTTHNDHEARMCLNLLTEKFERYEKDIEELSDSLHIARVGRRDLINYVKQLKDLLVRVNILLEHEVYPCDYPKDLLEEVKRAIE